MRSRASALMVAPLVALALAPSVAHAAGGLSPYRATVSAGQIADMKADGYDVQEAGANGDSGQQVVELIADGGQAAALEADGIALSPLAVEKPAAKSAA